MPARPTSSTRLLQEETPPEVPYQVIHGIWAAAIAAPIALVTAFAACLVGYLSKTSPEHFKLTNFIYTALISLGIGFVTIYAGWTYQQIELWLANGFLTWYIWKLATIIARIVAKKQIITKQQCHRQQPKLIPPKIKPPSPSFLCV